MLWPLVASLLSLRAVPNLIPHAGVAADISSSSCGTTQVCLQHSQASPFHTASAGTPSCSPCARARASDCLHAGCNTASRTEADAGRTFVSTHPNNTFKPGWKDHGNAAGDQKFWLLYMLESCESPAPKQMMPRKKLPRRWALRQGKAKFKGQMTPCGNQLKV